MLADNSDTSYPADPPQGLSRVIFFLRAHAIRAPIKRTIAFVDGQNLFHNVRSVFGHAYPNYDVQKLAEAVCAPRGWTLKRVQFYTGIPSAADNAFWHGFWSNKLAMMGRRGVTVYSRPLVYRTKTIQIPG